MNDTAHILVIVGLAAAALSAVAYAADRQRGRLPGDLRLAAGSLRIDVPFGTSLLLAVAATVLLNLPAHH